jgi:hypothetical protein
VADKESFDQCPAPVDHNPVPGADTVAEVTVTLFPMGSDMIRFSSENVMFTGPRVTVPESVRWTGEPSPSPRKLTVTDHADDTSAVVTVRDVSMTT